MLRVGSIVIRIDDLARQTAPWTAALDNVAREGTADGFALLRPREGRGPNGSVGQGGVRGRVVASPAGFE
ncbi:MAG: hypothetical protein WCH74_09815, partial [Chloroflexota bacterium]